jgi:hypothetical protein
MQELPKDSSSGMTLNAEPMQAQSEPATLASFTAKTIKNNHLKSKKGAAKPPRLARNLLFLLSLEPYETSCISAYPPVECSSRSQSASNSKA